MLSMKNTGRTIFYVLLFASFAMWFGGFGFYVSFVVPTGTDVFGSFEQGLITRQVTQTLNWLGMIAGLFMLGQAGSSLTISRSKSKVAQVAFVVLMLLMQLVLFWLHPQIDAHVDTEIREIAGDYDQFYFLHRLYLWASTIQWFAAWAWLICFCGITWCSTKKASA